MTEEPGLSISDNGARQWTLNGVLHRDGDLPALELVDGTKLWYQHGKLHRGQDRPARIDGSGTRYWYVNDRAHRDHDKPAIEYPDGERCWLQNGRRHRDQRPAVERPDGSYEWWWQGQWHRLDGPAVYWRSSGFEWWVQGEIVTCKSSVDRLNRLYDEGQGELARKALVNWSRDRHQDLYKLIESVAGPDTRFRVAWPGPAEDGLARGRSWQAEL